MDDFILSHTGEGRYPVSSKRCINFKTTINTRIKQPTVYILTNKRNGTLYVGVTSDLIKRVYQHKNNLVDGFSKKYKTHQLVYFE